MGTSRQITESQLERAKADLAVRVNALKAKGVDPKTFKRDPQWRRLDAHVRQISRRLRKVAEVEVNNETVARLKVERDTRTAAEKAERKTGAAGKKAKPEKEKGDGKPKKEKAPKEKGAGGPPKEKGAGGPPKAKGAAPKEKAPKKDKKE